MENRVKFYWLVFIFVLPVVIGSLLYYFHRAVPLSTVNHGALINPPVFVETTWATPKKWNIVYIPDVCGNRPCEKIAFTLRQLRTLLGKEADRVVLTVIVDNEAQTVKIPNVRTVVLTQAQYAALQKSLNQTVRNKIFLLDPIGNWFMSYPSDTDPMGILADLKRVLEVSQIG